MEISSNLVAFSKNTNFTKNNFFHSVKRQHPQKNSTYFLLSTFCKVISLANSHSLRIAFFFREGIKALGTLQSATHVGKLHKLSVYIYSPLAKLHSTYQLEVQYLRCQYVGHNEAKTTLKVHLNFCMSVLYLELVCVLCNFTND